MTEFWESFFKEKGALWQFEPSDSALTAVDLFRSHHIKTILIPGVGYGRNAKLFLDHGFEITGIEISKTAIDIAKANGLNFKIHHGSVTSMPFDGERFEGIFCYALIHCLNRSERKKFLTSCYDRLKSGGLMVFVVASKEMSTYGGGRYLSKDRYEISKGLRIFFYDSASVAREFGEFGLMECRDIEEPVKFMAGQEPLKLIYVVCKKN